MTDTADANINSAPGAPKPDGAESSEVSPALRRRRWLRWSIWATFVASPLFAKWAQVELDEQWYGHHRRSWDRIDQSPPGELRAYENMTMLHDSLVGDRISIRRIVSPSEYVRVMKPHAEAIFKQASRRHVEDLPHVMHHNVTVELPKIDALASFGGVPRDQLISKERIKALQLEQAKGYWSRVQQADPDVRWLNRGAENAEDFYTYYMSFKEMLAKANLTRADLNISDDDLLAVFWPHIDNRKQLFMEGGAYQVRFYGQDLQWLAKECGQEFATLFTREERRQMGNPDLTKGLPPPWNLSAEANQGINGNSRIIQRVRKQFGIRPPAN